MINENMRNNIVIKGAKENNLKNIDLTLPRNKLIVFTGLSGSGKSTLAFDTIFAEGQRRYVESLSSYARQFLGQLDRPNVESIDGLSPAISIDQKTTSRNPRSTVGTVTEIYDYFRLMYARIGKVHCPNCGKEITRQSIDQIVDRIMLIGDGERILVNAPVIRGKKGEYTKMFESLRNSGYVRVKVDGNIYNLDEEIRLEKNNKHNISVVIDRLVIKPDIIKRLTESVENALKMADGIVVIEHEGEEILFSDKYACIDCCISIEEVEPRLFSFNSPFGACPDCTGLGYKNEIDPSLIVKDPDMTLREGALSVSGWNIDMGSFTAMYFEGLSKKYGFSMDVPVKKLPKEIMDILLYGTDEKLDLKYSSGSFTGQYSAKYEGIVNNLARRYRETSSDYVKAEIEKYMVMKPCTTCHGMRLKKEALSVTVGGINIYEACQMSIDKLFEFLNNLQLTPQENMIAEQILNEIKARLSFLINVGVNYLTLGRNAGTLSGGEAQRIRLATQIGSGLMGVLYILDEPSIGLHQRDNGKLLSALKNLRDLGNTLIVVEHDEETIRTADYIVDIGPGAGEHGGAVVAKGSLQDIINEPTSITGQYLSGEKKIAIPDKRRQPNGKELVIIGAKQNNLKNITVKIPLGVMTAITGVSGSGKSSLINHILYPYLLNELNNGRRITGNCDRIDGLEHLDKVISIDQSPIGRTPRSNPATYTGAFTIIRDLFAATPDAQERGYKSGRFSFNVKGGRCEACQGDGSKRIEMHFLPDVYVPCEVCQGKRYNRETLQVKYKGKNISDVLDMTVEHAMKFFENIPSLYNKLCTLYDVGLGYIRLGQPAPTLSGGEAQRVKLATELAQRSTGKTIYILDEPSTGLHMADVDRLIKILQRFTDNGNTVVVIEHNLDIIKVCDYIIDLGPEGGDMGGTVVACGTPEEISNHPTSFTGKYLKEIFANKN